MTNSEAIYKCLENSVSETAAPIKLFSVDDSKGFCIEIFLNITYSSTASFADLMFINNATDASFKFGYCPYAKIENGYSIEIWKTTSSNITTYYAALTASSALTTALSATWNIRKELKYGNYTELYSSAESVTIPASTDDNAYTTLSGANKNFIMDSDLNVTNVKATGNISANDFNATEKLTVGTDTSKTTIDNTGISTNKITNIGTLENTGSLTVGTGTDNGTSSTFANTINGSLTVGNGLISTNAANFLGTITLSGSITPTTSNSLDLGESNFLFKSAYINNLNGTGSITGYNSATIGTLNINGQLNLKNSTAEAIPNSATSSTTNFIKFTGGANYSTNSSSPTQINLSDFFTLGNNGKYDCLSYVSNSAVSSSNIKRPDGSNFFVVDHLYLAILYSNNSGINVNLNGKTIVDNTPMFIRYTMDFNLPNLTYENSNSDGARDLSTTDKTEYTTSTTLMPHTYAYTHTIKVACILFIDLGSIGSFTNNNTIQSVITTYDMLGNATGHTTVNGYSQYYTDSDGTIYVNEYQGTYCSYTNDTSIPYLNWFKNIYNIPSVSSKITST